MENVTISKSNNNYQRIASRIYNHSLFIELISAALILLFTYAALSKLADYEAFKIQLSKSPILTDWANLIAWLLPAIEIIVVLLLLINKTRLVGFYSSLFLMTAFTTYILVILKFAYYIPCTCGGILSEMSWTTHFWFNLVFVLLILLGIFAFKH